jgi:hypothetical protein
MQSVTHSLLLTYLLDTQFLYHENTGRKFKVYDVKRRNSLPVLSAVGNRKLGFADKILISLNLLGEVVNLIYCVHGRSISNPLVNTVSLSLAPSLWRSLHYLHPRVPVSVHVMLCREGNSE